MYQNAKIYIAGHHGMVGSAIFREFERQGFTNLVGRTSVQLDLRNQQAVANFFETEKPEFVILAAAKVGGIIANNTYRGEFLYDNLQIQNNVIHQAYLHKVKKLLFLGSSCIYPKFASQPLQEDALLTGSLEPTNEPYAIAKIAGLKLCEAYRAQYGCDFISVMPTNLYGKKDNYDLQNSHVLPALLRKCYLGKCLENQDFEQIRYNLTHQPINQEFHTDLNNNEIMELLQNYGIIKNHEGIKIEIWGTGTPKREFLHADDLANACVWLMQNYSQSQFLNIGTGEDLSIKELAFLIKDIVGFQGELFFNTKKPDGTPRKYLDISKLKAIGWQANIELAEGIRKVYEETFEKY